MGKREKIKRDSQAAQRSEYEYLQTLGRFVGKVMN